MFNIYGSCHIVLINSFIKMIIKNHSCKILYLIHLFNYTSLLHSATSQWHSPSGKALKSIDSLITKSFASVGLSLTCNTLEAILNGLLADSQGSGFITSTLVCPPDWISSKWVKGCLSHSLRISVKAFKKFWLYDAVGI